MNKFKRSQLILLSILASLLIVTPLLSSSLRPAYLYFIINLLIIALSAESGLLSSLLSTPNHSSDDRKPHVSPTPPPNCPDQDVSFDRDINVVITQEKKPNKVVEKCNSEKIAGGGGGLKAAIARVKKCPSTPSIFFIGGGEMQSPEAAWEESEGEEQEEEEELAGISSQELFTKAENFIGNFYKQQKMQREESWNKIHGFYNKAF